MLNSNIHTQSTAPCCHSLTRSQMSIDCLFGALTPEFIGQDTVYLHLELTTVLVKYMML